MKKNLSMHSPLDFEYFFENTYITDKYQTIHLRINIFQYAKSIFPEGDSKSEFKSVKTFLCP